MSDGHRHVVISLHVVVPPLPGTDAKIAADYTILGKQLIDRVIGKDKHVEVAVHNLDDVEVENGPTSHAHKQAVESGHPSGMAPSAAQLATNFGREMREAAIPPGERADCPCGHVHRPIADLTKLWPEL